MASNLNRIFVYVPNAQVESFKNGAGLTEAYSGKIAFLGGTGEIMTHKEIFAINQDIDLNNLKDFLGANESNLNDKLGFEAEDIVDAIKTVYQMADSRLDEAEERLNTIQGDSNTEGSINKAASDAVARILDSAPEAFDTLKEIADWIATDSEGVSNLVNKVSSLENQVEEIEHVTALGLIDLQKQISDLTGGVSGSIQEQIDELSESIFGTSSDGIDTLSLNGLKARIDSKTATGSLSVGTSNTLDYDSTNGHLATIEDIANAINSIQMWETYSAS